MNSDTTNSGEGFDDDFDPIDGDFDPIDHTPDTDGDDPTGGDVDPIEDTAVIEPVTDEPLPEEPVATDPPLAYSQADTEVLPPISGRAEAEFADPAAEPDPDAADEPRRGLLAYPVRTALAAIIIGAVIAALVIFFRGGFSDVGDLGGTAIGDGNRPDPNPFSESVAGDCLNWPEDEPGKPELVDCADPHRFEVAGALDTALLPGTEFGAEAPWPEPERFAAIRDDHCPVIVDDYLERPLDPQGRLAVGLMYPSAVQWGKGARELRCGIEEPGPDGTQLEFTGRAAEIDQGFTWPPGTCVGINQATRQPTAVAVDCTQPHSFQTTGLVNLSERFGAPDSDRPWPDEGAQNAYLQTLCPNQTDRFFGGEQQFADTTLNVQWSVVSEVSWLAGTRTAICYVALPDRGGFATLVGDARQGTLLINGKRPSPSPAAPGGRSLPTPVPLPPGVSGSDVEIPAPSGGN